MPSCFGIYINPWECTNCGACVIACKRGVFKFLGKKVVTANIPYCNCCMECITVCAVDAIDVSCSKI
jgi:NAD-dependent dihydropyrimidine dehydrogenase PreA subunit